MSDGERLPDPYGLDDPDDILSEEEVITSVESSSFEDSPFEDDEPLINKPMPIYEDKPSSLEELLIKTEADKGSSTEIKGIFSEMKQHKAETFEPLSDTEPEITPAKRGRKPRLAKEVNSIEEVIFRAEESDNIASAYKNKETTYHLDEDKKLGMPHIEFNSYTSEEVKIKEVKTEELLEDDFFDRRNIVKYISASGGDLKCRILLAYLLGKLDGR